MRTRIAAIAAIGVAAVAGLTSCKIMDETPEAEKTCTTFASATVDPTVSNLRELGYSTDYIGGVWYISDAVSGPVAAEDDGFRLCGPVLTIDRIREEQQAVCDSGNVDVCLVLEVR